MNTTATAVNQPNHVQDTTNMAGTNALHQAHEAQALINIVLHLELQMNDTFEALRREIIDTRRDFNEAQEANNEWLKRVNNNVNRFGGTVISGFNRQERQVIEGRNSNSPRTTNNSNNNRLQPHYQEPNPAATLTRRPSDLMELWVEWTRGIGGRKPAKDFTSRERGLNKSLYSHRLIVWRIQSELVKGGYSVMDANDRIEQVTGASNVTEIIQVLKSHRTLYQGNGGVHPQLTITRNRR